MAITTYCPSCDATFKLGDEMAGKKVKCQKCDHVFVVPKEDGETGITASAPKTMSDASTTEISGSKPPPLSKKSRDSERRRDRPREKSGSGAGTIVLVILLIVGGVLGCGGCMVGAGWWLWSDGGDIKPAGPGPVVKVDKVGDFPLDRDRKPVDGIKIDKIIPPPDGKIKIDGIIKIDGNKDFPLPVDGLKPKIDPPLPGGAINIAFGPDGTYQNESVLTQADPANHAGKRHKLYLLPMKQGEDYQIDMISKEFDSYLFLLDDKNIVLQQDDDGGGFPNARINYRAKQTAIHRIHATYFGGGLGRFTLIVRRIDPTKDPAKNPPLIAGNDVSHRTYQFKIGEAPVSQAWANDGKSFFILSQNGSLQRYSADTGGMTMEHNYNKFLGDNSNLAMSGEGLLMSVSSDNQVWVIDPDNFANVKKRIDVPALRRVAAGTNSRFAVALSTGFPQNTLRVLELDRGVAAQPINLKAPVSTIAVSPNGSYLFTAEAGKLNRLRLDNLNVTWEETSDNLVTFGEQIHVSPGSRYVCLIGNPTFLPPPQMRGLRVFNVGNLKNPVVTVPSQFPKALAVDPMSNWVLVNDNTRPLVMFNMNGIKKVEQDFPGVFGGINVREFAVSPQGNEALMRANDRVVYLKLKPNNDVIVKKDPDPGPKVEPKKGDQSLVLNTFKAGTFSAKELSIPTPGATVFTMTEPVWDGQGRYLYHLLGGTTLRKINRDFKVELSVELPMPCHHLRMTAEGLVVGSTTSTEILLLDSQSLEVRKKIVTPISRWIGGGPGSSTIVTLTGNDLSLIDLKQGKQLSTQITPGAPASFGKSKNLAVSPDGKYLFVQAIDYSLHRMRIEGNRIVHENVKSSPTNAVAQFQISTDSKQAAITFVSGPGVATGKVKTTDIFPIGNWDKADYAMPQRMKLIAFDSDGGMFTETDKNEIRFYPSPAKKNQAFQQWQPPAPVRRLVAAPNAVGCLILTANQAYWLEPGKN